MKKGLITFLLIALCCTAVFAADLAAKVTMKVSVGNEGFSFKSSDWEPQFKVHVSGDNSGGEFSLAFVNFEKIRTTYQIWFKPKDTLKYTFGAVADNSFEGLDFSDLYAYGKLDFSKDGVSVYGVGFAYETNLGKSNDESSIYVIGDANKGNENDIWLHADAYSKLDIDGRRVKLDEISGEIAYQKNKNFRKVQVDANEIDRHEDFRSDWQYYDESPAFYNIPEKSQLYLGLRYKYLADKELKNDAGLFAYSYVKTGAKEREKPSYEIEAELGFHGVDLGVGFNHFKDDKTQRAYVTGSLSWADGFNAKVNEGFFWFTKALEGEDFTNLKAEFDYYNNKTESENGFYVTPTLSGKSEWCGYELSSEVGLDQLMDFHWDIGFKPTFNF